MYVGTYLLLFLILPKRNIKAFVRSALFALSYAMTAKKHARAHTHTQTHNILQCSMQKYQEGYIWETVANDQHLPALHLHYIEYIKGKESHGILEVRKIFKIVPYMCIWFLKFSNTNYLWARQWLVPTMLCKCLPLFFIWKMQRQIEAIRITNNIALV